LAVTVTTFGPSQLGFEAKLTLPLCFLTEIVKVAEPLPVTVCAALGETEI
jgi:hypothetical protein